MLEDYLNNYFPFVGWNRFFQGLILLNFRWFYASKMDIGHLPKFWDWNLKKNVWNLANSPETQDAGSSPLVDDIIRLGDPNVTKPSFTTSWDRATSYKLKPSKSSRVFFGEK